MKPKKKQDVIYGAELISRHGGDSYVGDIHGQDDIDGKLFWIVRVGERVFKLAKDGYDLKRKTKKRS